MARAVLLFSGGLDSILAAHILKREGVEILPLYFYTVFSSSSCEEEKSRLLSYLTPLNTGIEAVDFSQEHIEMVKNPLHGYGGNLNPCVDCKIFMFREAARYMQKTGASFIATGEVLGERPMSQRRDVFSVIENESGLKKMILRPLSAKRLPPTVAEEEGLVDRENLYGITGRGRRPQMELASRFGIEDYPTPSGGCLLTNPSFCKRVKDLMKYTPDFGRHDIELLKVGRHFRISPRAKIIVARDEKESELLDGRGYTSLLRFYPLNGKGPVSVGVGDLSPEDVDTALQIIAGYCKSGTRGVTFKILTNEGEETRTVRIPSSGRDYAERFLIW